MATVQHLSIKPRSYGLGWLMRSIFLLFALACAAGDGFMFLIILRNPAPPSGILLVLIPLTMCLGIFFALASFRYRLTLDQESVTLVGVILTRSLRMHDIKGRRVWTNRNGSYLAIEGKNPGDKRVVVSNYFKVDDEWRNWVATLPDLDDADRNSVMDEITRSAELGGSPEERLANLKNAKTTAVVLSVLAVAAGASLLLFRQRIDVRLFRAIDVFLVALPWIALWMHWRSPLLYSIMGGKKDPRPTLVLLPFVGAFGLLISPLDNLLIAHPMQLAVYGCLLGLLLGYLLYRASSPAMRKTTLPTVPLMIGFVYSLGVARQANMQLDASTPREIQTVVLQMNYSSGKSTTYYLYLPSWERPGTAEKVAVSKRLYQSVSVGDPICVTTHEGALHLAWYTIQTCSTPPRI